MAFNNTNTVPSDNAGISAIPNNRKAAAFMNFYLPKTDGSRAKVGAFALVAGRPLDDWLIAQLSADMEGNGKKIMNKLEMEFREVTATTAADIGSQLDL